MPPAPGKAPVERMRELDWARRHQRPRPRDSSLGVERSRGDVRTAGTHRRRRPWRVSRPTCVSLADERARPNPPRASTVWTPPYEHAEARLAQAVYASGCGRSCPGPHARSRSHPRSAVRPTTATISRSPFRSASDRPVGRPETRIFSIR